MAVLLRLAFALVSISQFETPDTIRRLTRDTEHYTEAAETLRTEFTLQSTGIRIFGPAYPTFLALLSSVTGRNTVAMLGIQILVASAGVVLLAMLTYQIMGKRRVAMVAGVFHAVSLSASGLSIAFMGEALGLVITLLGFLVFCRATTRAHLAGASAAGMILGMSILTCSSAVILLLALPLLALASPCKPGEPWVTTLRSRSSVLAVATAMMLLLPSLWIVHNRVVYGVHYLRQIEAVNLIRSASAFRLYQDGTPFEQSMAEAGDSTRVWTQRLGNEHQAFEMVSHSVFKEAVQRNPWICLAVYLGTIDDNVNTDDGVWINQFPEWHDNLMSWKATSEKYLLRYRMLALCIAGFWILHRAKEFRLSWVLAGLFAVFAMGAGVSPWQGNRLFYSGQIASLPLMAVAFLAAYDGLRKRARRQNTEASTPRVPD